MQLADLPLRGAGGEPVDFVRTIVSHGLPALFSIRGLRREFELLEPEHRNPFDLIPGRSVRALGTVAMHVPPLAMGATWIWLLVAG